MLSFVKIREAEVLVARLSVVESHVGIVSRHEN